MKDKLLIHVVDVGNDYETVAIFYDAQKAAKYCEKHGCFAYSLKDQEGKLKKGAKCFYEALINFDESEKVHIEKTTEYKYGSENNPCHNPMFFCGTAVHQDIGYNVAWGVTEEEATRRCKKNALEGCKKAAASTAYNKAVDEANEKYGVSWTPYGFDMHKQVPEEIREKVLKEIQETSDKAYEEATL